MRLLFLSTSGQLGGAEAVLLDMLASLRRAEPAWPLHLISVAPGPLIGRAAALGVDSRVVALPPALARLGEAGVASGEVDAGVLVSRLAPAWSAIRTYVPALGAAVSTIQPDVIHSNGLKMHLLAARAVAGPGPAIVWHLHDYLGTRPATAALLRWHRSRCAAVVANSASVAADARAVLGGTITVHAVLNAIDLARFAPFGERADLDALSGLTPAPDGTLRVGLLATFARWKGHEVFLDAIARLPRDLPVRGYIIGGDVYQTDGSQYRMEELQQAAARRGAGGRIGFTGFVDRPEVALRALDVVVHASTAPEPFGLAIVEAMACGRAVVASAAGGAAEVITPGVDALVHRPGDARGLADQLATLLSDATLRARLGAAARDTTERRFDRARLAGDLLPIYRAAVARR
jgi:glycosyltransferase involved in cell wall biosynthesis